MALLYVGAVSAGAEDKLRPTFVSEVANPDETILPLLKAACGEGVRTVTSDGQKAFGCGEPMDEILASRHRPRRYAWATYAHWQADGVLFGHFLSPTSEDVAVSGFGSETHPALWGGTLLLTKKAGKWTPVWYKAGVITRHCRRVSMATGRQILFCEETDGGMGHRIHGTYVVDFTAPKFAWHSVVLMADSYASLLNGGVQIQSIDRISFDETEQGEPLVRIYVRHGRVNLRFGYKGDLPTPKVSKYQIDFRLEGRTFKVTPQTAAVAKLFGVKTQ